MPYGDTHPIAALATPLAGSALALIRTSGGGFPSGGDSGAPGAVELLARVFSRPEKLRSARGNSIVHGWIVDPESGPGGEPKKIDEVLVSVYRAPKSYTGEDGADISCHGGIAVVKAVMAALKKAGFRDALPGEFSFRAFMNGKQDLTRSESVMELVSAKTHKAREQAVRRLSGALEKEVSAIKALLVEVLAGTEIYLDYSEDEFFGNRADDEAAGRLPDRNLAEEAGRRLKVLSELWRRERIYADGALAVIAGRPNAGKSSLFNYLLREDRSIVTDIPGTTRDWIEALISVEDIPLRLADTAGIRAPVQTDKGEPAFAPADEAERIGIQRSLELLDRADIILYVIDGVQGITGEDRKFLLTHKEANPEKPLLVLWNKADLVRPPLPDKSEFPEQLLGVSAKTGEGIPGLLCSVARLLETPLPESLSESCGQNAAGPGTARQKELIDTALASVEEALALASPCHDSPSHDSPFQGDRGEPLDIIAPLFRSAVNALGEITGEVSSADILEVMFSRFCVGK
ncbi:MAG: tRNA uridine-5-carboxymethylaminomethyl(34) synthesis GTPase MnmE [Treponema sp.]|nr:tRNA uridine-5-carboxymethylaminomethyl(34) synthesis GTPase MnmE [Treponema sp.]